MALAISAQRSRFLLLGLVLLHLAAISHQVDGGGGVSLLQRSVFLVLAPLQHAVGALVGGVAEAWRGYAFHRQTYLDNRRLEARLRELQVQLQTQAQRVGESDRLRELLGLQRALPLDTLAAQVVARGGVPWFRSLTIDRGEADGVQLNAPVLSPTGVVGRVFEVGPHAARVQVLLDRDSGAGVLVTSATSGGEDLLLKYVPDRSDVVLGDLVVTSGADRIYPKGLVVGRVRYIGGGSGLFREIHVEPSARFDRLEEVLVVRRSEPALDTPRSVQ